MNKHEKISKHDYKSHRTTKDTDTSRTMILCALANIMTSYKVEEYHLEYTIKECIAIS